MKTKENNKSSNSTKLRQEAESELIEVTRVKEKVRENLLEEDEEVTRVKQQAIQVR